MQSAKVSDVLLKKISEKVEAFKGLELHEMAAVFQFADKKVFNPGDAIVVEGKLGSYMYLIMDGEAIVSKQMRVGESMELRRLGPADSFGEMSVIDNEPRSATVTAVTHCKILRLNAQALRVRPEIGLRIFHNIARSVVRKLRDLELRMAEVSRTKGDELSTEAATLPTEK